MTAATRTAATTTAGPARPPRRAVLLGLLAAGAGMAGCAPAGEPEGPADPVASALDTATVRTDPAPITSRFPGLGDVVEVRWLGGTLGDSRAPGPSTYVIEALVTLTPAGVRRLTASYPFEPTAAPQVPAPLRPALPAGAPWSRSPRLDAEVGPAGWLSRVSLSGDGPVVHLSARGE